MANKRSLTSQLRIIGAIAAKDVIDALKNRTILSIVIGVFFVVLAGRAMSLIIKLQQTQTALVAGPNAVEFVEAAGESEAFRVIEVENADEVQDVLSTSATPYLGIVLPDDWQTRLDRQDEIEMTGYIQHWLSRSDVRDTLASFEAHFSQALGATVRIEGENIVYPSLNFSGTPFMISIGLVVAVMMIGLILVPILMLEEKEQRTIDVLLISPATYSQIVIGKALAGIVYSLAAVIVLVLVNANYIVQWDLLIASVLLGTLLTVLIGLFLGTVFDQVSTMNMVMGIIALPLIVPIFLRQFNPGTLPVWLDTILPWIPSSALDELFRMSFVQDSYPDRVAANLGFLLAAVVLMLILNSWRIRRLTA